MDYLKDAWGAAVGKRIALWRLFGFACFWAWMLMIFYSTALFRGLSDERTALYANLMLSLAVLTITLLFVAVVSRQGVRMGNSRALVVAATAAMAAGTAAAPWSDPNTPIGMLALGLGGVMTGTGSAVLFVCWVEQVAEAGGRLALVELTFSTCIACALGLLLSVIPTEVAVAAVAALPVASAALLRHGTRGTAGEARGTGPVEGAVRQPLSRRSVALFAKALAGVALVGGIEGFFDVMAGYQTYVVSEQYGMWLLMVCLACAFVAGLVALFFSRDSVFYTYRFAMLAICLGCLLTPFMGDNNTAFGALVFGGYHVFSLVVCTVCIDVAAGFLVGRVRAVCLGFVALYAGELAGSGLVHAMEAVPVDLPPLSVVTLVAVSALFVSHLFLFTETDLIRVGVGELDVPTAEAMGVAHMGWNASMAGLAMQTGAAVARPAGHRASGVGDMPFAVQIAADATGEESADGGADDAATAMEQGIHDVVSQMASRYGLSPRECDVLPLLLEGRTISRIQEALYISAGTVSTHIRHIYQKTGVNNRQELIDLAHDLGVGNTGNDD